MNPPGAWEQAPFAGEKTPDLRLCQGRLRIEGEIRGTGPHVRCAIQSLGAQALRTLALVRAFPMRGRRTPSWFVSPVIGLTSY